MRSLAVRAKPREVEHAHAAVLDAQQPLGLEALERLVHALPRQPDELAQLLVRFAALLEHVPELAGVVANPVIVGPGGLSITEAWVRVAPDRLPTDPQVRRLDRAPGLILGI